jgi:hypothetical protein
MDWVVRSNVPDSDARRQAPARTDRANRPASPAADETRAWALPDDETRAWTGPDDETRAWPASDETRAWQTVSTPPTKQVVAPATDRPSSGRPGRTGRRRALGAIAAVLVVAGAVTAAVLVGKASEDPPATPDPNAVRTDTPDPKHPPQDDVAIDGCKIERTGAQVSGTVRNPTDSAADYMITIDLRDPQGATIASADLPAMGVAPVSKTTWSGTIPPVPTNAASATCKVVKVDRYRSK